MLGQGALCQWVLGEPEELGGVTFAIAGAATVDFIQLADFETEFTIKGRATFYSDLFTPQTPGNAYFGVTATLEATFEAQDSATASFDVEPSASVAVTIEPYAYIHNGSTTPLFSVEVGNG